MKGATCQRSCLWVCSACRLPEWRAVWGPATVWVGNSRDKRTLEIEIWGSSALENKIMWIVGIMHNKRTGGQRMTPWEAPTFKGQKERIRCPREGQEHHQRKKWHGNQEVRKFQYSKLSTEWMKHCRQFQFLYIDIISNFIDNKGVINFPKIQVMSFRRHWRNRRKN